MYINVNAVILRVRRDQDNAKRLALFTEELGRVNAIAIGVEKPGARLAAATEPWVRARFRLWKKESHPHARVTGGVVDDGHMNLRTDWRRTSSAAFICEWTEQLTAFEQPHPEKYDLLCRALKTLQNADPLLTRLAYFVQFLELAGYGPTALSLDAAGMPEVEALLLHLRNNENGAGAPEKDFERWGGLLEDRLMRFVAPLTSRPFTSKSHEAELHAFERDCAVP
jgi:DNA repair protein RecO